MRRWIRPSGVVLFLIVVLLLVLLGWALSGPALRLAVEKGGTSINGARVEVGSARLALFPLGVVLNRLQVTNPERPLENRVEVGRIALTLDLRALVWRKLVVREASVEGIRLNTPRRHSGAVEKAPPAPAEEGGFALPPMTIPSVADILGKETLRSVMLAEAIPARAASAEARLKAKAAALPDQARAEEYRARLERLASGKVDAAKVAEAKKLRDEIQKELDKVKDLTREVSADAAALKGALAEAQGAVGEDVTRLKNKYAFTPEGMANATSLFFGPEVGGYIRKGADLLRMAQKLPLPRRAAAEAAANPPRHRGIDIPFPQRPAYPDFHLVRAALSASIPAGDLSGELLDLSTDQALVGRPMKVTLAGENLAGGASLSAQGVFDRTLPDAPRDQLSGSYRGWTLSALALAKGGDFPVTLRQAGGVAEGTLVVKGEALEGKVDVDLTGVGIEAGGKSDSRLARSLTQSLSEVKTLSLDVSVGGTLGSPQLGLKSDLDRILKDAVGRAVKEEVARLEADLRREIDRRTGELLDQGRAAISSLEAKAKELEAVKADLEKTLKQKAPTAPALPKL